MLTLIKNIERFNKRYNKKRGSAMLMVLMTMAIIIVVGSSMLFVTLSSFSNSIADTHQERAYNAALTVSETLKNSGNLDSIITTYADKLEKSEDVVLKFSPTNELDGNQPVDYMVVNGVKVYVTLSRAKNTTKFDKVLVDVKGVKGSQERTISFEVNSQPSIDSATIKDTFGNSFVMNSNMGKEKTDPSIIIKRIEGDVSINCFETVDGKRVMKTRIFNPIVLEGVTGSIYANGDLIIGAPDNMIRVQGNIYVDGNLTIRGLSLGVNLPALRKKYYVNRYLHYHTFAKQLLDVGIGKVENPYSKSEIKERDSASSLIGEAMYEKLSDGTYRPIQTYDKLTHYTLLDRAGEDATEYSFWTKVYGENNKDGNYSWEKATIKFKVPVGTRTDGAVIYKTFDAMSNEEVKLSDGSTITVNNAQYLGASMYEYTPDGSLPIDEGTPIMQFPQGGNVYCSGDIIFDTVNYGYVATYDAGVFNFGTTDGEQEEETKPSETIFEQLNNLLKKTFGVDLINAPIDYYSLSYYNANGGTDGRIPVRTKIAGDVFCQGRMIISPDKTVSYEDYKKDERIGLTTDFSMTNKLVKGKLQNSYMGGRAFANTFSIQNTNRTFLTQCLSKWNELKAKNWNGKTNNTIQIQVPLDQFDIEEGTITENKDALKSFVKAYTQAYEAEKSQNSTTINSLKTIFEQLDGDNYSYLTGGDYTQFGGGKNNLKGGNFKIGKDEKWVDFYMPEFSATSNLYIQNEPIRKGMGNTEVEKSEIYPTEDNLRVVTNTADITEDGRKMSVVDGIAYTAALTVRYCEITVNNVYCSGAISVLESKLPGYEASAFVKVNNQYFGSDYVKNELKYVSILEFLKAQKILNESISDNDIIKNYFSDKNGNIAFKDETQFVFEPVNEENNEQTHYETWTWGISYSNDVTHYRKAFVLRAHYEMSVNWENDELWEKNLLGKWKQKKETDWDKSDPFSNGKFVADILYCFADRTTYKGKFYPGTSSDGINVATGKLVVRYYDSEDQKYKYKVVEVEDGELTDPEKAVVEYLQKNGNCINLEETAFIDLNAKPVDSKGKVYDDYSAYFKANSKWFGNADKYDDPRKMPDQSVITYYKSGKVDSWFTSASATETYPLKLNKFKYLVGGEDLSGLHSLLSVLSDEFILSSQFLTNRSIIAMFSNGSNDFDGIINKDMVRGSAITGAGAEVNFGGSSAKVNFETMMGKTLAFANSSLYGMYLVKDKKYADVDPGALVQAVFDEISSSKFATVVEANADQEKSKESVKNILEKLKEENDLIEYNAFDIYGAKNDGETQKGKTQEYVCADGEKLKKKDVSWTTSINNTDGALSWLQSVGDLFGSSFGYWTLKDTTNDVENDSSLRLMDFYNKDVPNSARLRADSTFAVDESFNKSQGMAETITKFFSAKRSEVQYTITDNTYFNFNSPETSQVIFAASTDGIDGRARMNIRIDTTKKNKDIYLFFHCEKFLFEKCTFQVIGEKNVYIMLVDDTSINANAFKKEVNLSGLGLSNDPKDNTNERYGTHFKSNTYKEYGKITFNIKADGEKVKVSDLGKALKIIASVTSTQPAGNMFIIGMGNNKVKFGRGGSVNALVYIPNGKYSNESTGLFNIIPFANSVNNEASIVAKNIYLGGSSRGQLIFTSYDVSQTGNKNNSSAGIVMDGLISPDSVTHGTEWVAGNYYYG